MDISKARQLKAGDRVHCPADRGEKAFTGKVVSVVPDEEAKFTGNCELYIWVEVQGPHHKSIWPSNRLG